MQYIRLIKYLFIHKFYVFVECVKYGIFWRGIKHDMSKFFPPEFIPYANRHFSKEQRKDSKWYRARFHHKKYNSHHWEYWCYPKSYKVINVIEMPKNAAKEMVADWYGQGRADAAKKDLHEWYKDNQNEIILHSNTRIYVEELLYLRK